MIPETSITDGRVGFRSERGPVLLALLVSMALVAIDSTIIATAVPSVVRSVGGFADFPWLFSVYLLAQAVTIPVYGKLADVFGRKPVILFGIGLFLVGSLLCAVAWSMPVLIATRLVQGLGAGAIQPMSLTIVGDLYSLRERAKVQGYIASLWGGASLVGPTLGGVLSQYASWRWIFLINVPVSLLAMAMLRRHFHERFERGRPDIDYLGAGLLTSGLALLVLGVLEGGQAWAWTSIVSVVVLVGGPALIVIFVAVETRAADPVLPLWIFRQRVLVASGLVSFCIGGVVLGLSSYVPTFVQDVLGGGPVVAGLALAALTAAWAIAASQSGRLYLRIGLRSCALIGASVIVLGSAVLLLLGRHSSIGQVGATCFIVGVGVGLVSGPVLIAAQMSVQWQHRGVVTGSNLFCRSLGSALCVAGYGAIANSGAIARAGPSDLDVLRLGVSVHHVFQAVLVAALCIFACVALMPRLDQVDRRPWR